MSDDVGVMALVLPLLRGFEGLRLVSVPVGRGRYEVGYGHTCFEPCVIDVIEAERLLSVDAKTAARAVQGALSVEVSASVSVPQRAALVSLTYNIGAGALRRSTLMRKLNAGDVAGAAAEFGRWVHADGGVSPGLVARRAQERDLFLSGSVGVSGGVAAEVLPGDDRGISEAGAAVPVVPDAEKGAAVDAAAAEPSGNWFLERAKEPSTWRGIGGLLAAAGVLSLGSVDALIAVGMAVWSAVEVIRKERGAGAV